MYQRLGNSLKLDSRRHLHTAGTAHFESSQNNIPVPSNRSFPNTAQPESEGSVCDFPQPFRGAHKFLARDTELTSYLKPENNSDNTSLVDITCHSQCVPAATRVHTARQTTTTTPADHSSTLPLVHSAAATTAMFPTSTRRPKQPHWRSTTPLIPHPPLTRQPHHTSTPAPLAAPRTGTTQAGRARLPPPSQYQTTSEPVQATPGAETQEVRARLLASADDRSLQVPR